MGQCNNFHSYFYFVQKAIVPYYLSHWQYHFCRIILSLKIDFGQRFAANRLQWPMDCRDFENFTFADIFLTLSDFFLSEWVWNSSERDTLLRICWGITINFNFRLFCGTKMIEIKSGKRLFSEESLLWPPS